MDQKAVYRVYDLDDFEDAYVKWRTEDQRKRARSALEHAYAVSAYATQLLGDLLMSSSTTVNAIQRLKIDVVHGSFEEAYLKRHDVHQPSQPMALDAMPSRDLLLARFIQEKQKQTDLAQQLRNTLITNHTRVDPTRAAKELPNVPAPPKKKKKTLKEQIERVKRKVVPQMLNAAAQFPLDRFPFKSHPECTSSNRKAPFYLSRDALIDIITQDPDLKKHFKRSPKGLTKGELCDTIFPQKN